MGLSLCQKLLTKISQFHLLATSKFLGYKNVTESMERFMALADVIETNKMIIDQTLLLRKGEENYVA